MKTSLTADQIAVMAILARTADDLRKVGDLDMAGTLSRILADYVQDATREE